jgi:hypothetical protein
VIVTYSALGWHRWRECEQKYAYGLVERFITALVDAGHLADRARGSLVRFSFWMLGGAGLALAEAPEADRPRLREEWRYLIRQTISGLRAGHRPPARRLPGGFGLSGGFGGLWGLLHIRVPRVSGVIAGKIGLWHTSSNRSTVTLRCFCPITCWTGCLRAMLSGS